VELFCLLARQARTLESASAPDQPYEPKILAKKHRITLEEAEKVIAEHGADQKASDKAARRIAT
jgi:hypothetical protein